MMDPSQGGFPIEVPFSRTSRFFPASEFEGKHIPPRPWLAPDLVPSGTVTLLGGDGGTGKSLLALQLACAVVTGGQWLGRAVAGGGAVFVSAEDDEAELQRRTDDIRRHLDQSFRDLHRMTLRSLAGEDALLAKLDRATGALIPSPLFTELDRRIADERPALVVLDTLADLFPGNENDRTQARQFIGILRGLAIRHECAVLLLAHPSLSGLNSGSGTSGSTGWNNSVRSRLYLERIAQGGYEANPDARVLKTMKANHGRIGGEIGLTWKAGVFIADAVETGLDRKAGSAKAERVFLKLLTAFTEIGRKVNHAGGQTYAPKVFAASPDAEGCNQRSLATAMEVLLASGKLAIGKEGPPSKQRQFLTVVDHA
jgi:RecA-family ATPase